jgi:type III secretory pathway component EscR
MSKEYPLYPELSEEGKKEADLWLQSFRDKMKEIAEETLSEVYGSCVEYIESDSWSNFRNEMLEGFKNYKNRKIQAEFDFAEIRKQIYKEYRDEIIQDLNQDLVKSNKELEEIIEKMQEERARRN